MRILGVDCASEPTPTSAYTLVLLDADGALAAERTLESLPAVAAAVGELAADDVFLLAANVPVVVPARAARIRPVENLVRRQLGYRLPAGGRTALTRSGSGVAGEALMAGLAAAGRPCLPFPDRDRRRNGIAETWPGINLRSLVWESGVGSSGVERAGRDQLFRAHDLPPYRRDSVPARSTWAHRAFALELALRYLGDPPGYDLQPVRRHLDLASDDDGVERAAALFDALLIAGTARRYLEQPERSLFLGDENGGYVILPADDFVRSLMLGERRREGGQLFPQASLRERLGTSAKVRSPDLLQVPGRPQRLEARFTEHPRYEFDNVDEMLWWKHCRHVGGPRLPTEGLNELVVTVGRTVDPEAAGNSALHLVRSRHRTLSFRFDPPTAWRERLSPRDGRAYPLVVLRAIYETLASEE